MALLALLAAALAATPAHAAARPAIGMGEQKASMFADARWRDLGLMQVRYIAPWDALSDPRQLALLDAWMTAAREAGAQVLLGFAHSLRSAKLARRLPSPARFEREFDRFRARYPDVRQWIAWNEANHPLSLTANRPRRAARYFEAIARNCARCRVVAADVLDIHGMTEWVGRFKQHVRFRPRLWGLHNYGDANSFGSGGTRALLAVTGRGKVWFTETGGLVLRREFRGKRVTGEFGYRLRHAARATLHALALARLSRRIERVYLYHWQAPRPVTNWDSAFIDSYGKPRRAYHALVRALARMRS